MHDPSEWTDSLKRISLVTCFSLFENKTMWQNHNTRIRTTTHWIDWYNRKITQVLSFQLHWHHFEGKVVTGSFILGVNWSVNCCLCWCWHKENGRMLDSLTPDDLSLLCQPITQQWQILHPSSNQSRKDSQMGSSSIVLHLLVQAVK